MSHISESQSESSSLPCRQIDSDKHLERNKTNNRGERMATIIESMCLGEVGDSFGHNRRELGKFQKNVDSSTQALKSNTVSSTAEKSDTVKKEGKQDFVPKTWERTKAYSEELSSTSSIEDKVGFKENFFLGAKETEKNMARLDLAKSTLMEKRGNATFNGHIIFESVRGKEELTQDWALENCSFPHQGDMNYMATNISFLEKNTKVCAEKMLTVNPKITQRVDDLIQLTDLNESSVLYNLQNRYDHDIIYTKAGPVLIAINPYKGVSLFGNDILESSWKVGDTPHVYKTADSVFHAMRKDGGNQSIVISGESGAGKTETAKIAMQYLVSFGAGSKVGDQILQANLILEAFGNAKTLSNNNSSRFGKLIDLHFDDSGRLQGSKIHAYLLEKSRVVHQTKGERSYHIFYQLCVGASSSVRERLKLGRPEEYHFLNQSNCLTIDDFDDVERFKATMRAFNLVQISLDDQDKVFAMLAAVLWLGNITFSSIDNDNHVAVDRNEALQNSAKLLGCDVEELNTALSIRKILVGSENIMQMLTLSQAVGQRNALAKTLYSYLFDWVVDNINKSLGTCWMGRTISILDIYGFESFDNNNFEQFCINYANERLHQYSNQHLFKLVQEEYISESIDWTSIEFEDSEKCLHLIEKKPLGIISLLVEESTFPNGTDLSLASKLKKHLQGHACFKGQKGHAFSLCHYAGEVMYNTSGFLEKNRDFLSCDLVKLLSSCKCQLPQLFASAIFQGSSMPRENGKDIQKKTIVAKFKGQLVNLIERLENTSPHFLWCIKPNRSQLPGVFDHKLVLQQLLSCGLIEVVRISKCGYPTKMTHERFTESYGVFLSQGTAGGDALNVCKAIVSKFNISPEMYQVGLTKMFFRAGQIEKLEDIQTRTLHGVEKVQNFFRGYKVRRCFKNLRRLAIFLQSLVRCAIERNRYKVLKERDHAAITIQREVRFRNARQTYIRTRKMVLLIQAAIRGWIARSNMVMLHQSQEQTLSLTSNVEESNACRNTVSLNDGVRRAKVISKDDPESPTTIMVQPSLLIELQKRLHRAEATLRETEAANALLHQKLQWYEARMASMENIRTKQDAEGYNLLHEDYWVGTDSIERANTSDETSWPERNFLHSDRALARELNAERSLVGRLVRSFELRAQGSKDCSADSPKVKICKNLNPKKELSILIHGYYLWKNGFKIRLYEMEKSFKKFGSSTEKL